MTKLASTSVVIALVVFGATFGIGGYSYALLTDVEGHGNPLLGNEANRISAGGWCDDGLTYDSERQACVDENGNVVVEVTSVSPEKITEGTEGSVEILASIPRPNRVDRSSLTIGVGASAGNGFAPEAVECTPEEKEDWSCSVEFDRADLLDRSTPGETVTVAVSGTWDSGQPFVGTAHIEINEEDGDVEFTIDRGGQPTRPGGFANNNDNLPAKPPKKGGNFANS
mgnify:CR=1 FL=1